jgi:hypothetical protein
MACFVAMKKGLNGRKKEKERLSARRDTCSQPYSFAIDKALSDRQIPPAFRKGKVKKGSPLSG